MQEMRNKRIAFIMAVLITVLFIPTASFATSYSDDAKVITYDTRQEKEVDFELNDFQNACKKLTDVDLDFVRFTLPSSKYGTLYLDYDKPSNSAEVKDGKSYYADISPKISKITFLPEDDYTGTVTIKYTGYNTKGEYYNGSVKINVDNSSKGSANDLTYSIDSDEKLRFDEDDFNKVCDKLNDRNLDYVEFTLPSSSAGTLYYKYTSKDNYDSKVSESKKYKNDESPSISDVTFVPKEDYDGTVKIEYTGYDVKGHSFDGLIRISVDEGKSSTTKDITYTVKSGKTLVFDKEDFNRVCDKLKDKDLDYVNFTLPSSSKGILYYDYDNGQYDSKVSESKNYYYSSTPKLSKVAFVPNNSFSGIFKIDYKGYDVKGNSYTGVIEITVDGGNLQNAGIVSYSAGTGAVVYFKDEDFNNVCKKLMNKNLDYVKFTLPSTSSGKLYYGYTSPKNYTSEVSANTKYYYGGGNPFLLNVAYVPANSTPGTTSIEYTGYDLEGTAYKGTVQITVSSTGTQTTTPVTQTTTGVYKKSQHFKDVDEAYSWAVDYADNLYNAGVITGSTGSDKQMYFYPSTKITRGDFMLFLMRALNLPSNSSAGNFTDVTKGSYYYDAIGTAKALGIAQGSDNKFYPNSSITRQDAMVLALRAMNKSGKTVVAGDLSSLAVYSDNNVIDSYAKDAVATLVKAGIITGSDDNKMHPMENITRIQAVAIIYRIKYK